MTMRRKDISFYVYRIFDGLETVYVGKGSGNRLSGQKRNFGCDGEILEQCKSDDHAFERERYWIATLKPSENKHAGGNGGRCQPKPLTPIERKAKRDWTKFEHEYNEVGPKRYCARILARKLYNGNCEQFGISKTELSRLREVACGPRC